MEVREVAWAKFDFDRDEDNDDQVFIKIRLFEELALKDGKRAYDNRFLYVVKDSEVELSRI